MKLLEKYTPDITKGKVKIYLLRFETLEDPVLQRIGRLRTETFGQVGAGTNREVDVDEYDLRNTHIVISDDEDIIGSYRVTKMSNLLIDGKLQSHISRYYNLSDRFYEKVEELMELGRSFIQRKYWSGNYLDYLWYGIGEYVRRNPNIKLLYGSISIGNKYSDRAKSYIKAFVDKWYAEYDDEITPKHEYIVDLESYNTMMSMMNNDDPKFDLKVLKKSLEEMEFSVPPLLKKYLNITEIGGAKIKSSAFEPTFNSSSFLLVLDIRQLKDLYRDRYFPFFKVAQ